MKIDVKKITVIEGDGTDTCVVEINNKIIEGCWPFENNLKLKFETAHKKGMEYCAKNFPNIPLERINTKGE
jgi:isocitrate/isopropylmalate dehydrogenase